MLQKRVQYLGITLLVLVSLTGMCRAGQMATEQQKLTASDGESGDYFGADVAIDGDTAVIGMDADFNKGDVYVFIRNGDTWTQQQQLTATFLSGAGEHFGSSVALRGDTLVVGAYGAYDMRGGAVVFHRSNGVWSSIAYEDELMPLDGDSGDYFGWSVAISEDENTIAIGALNAGANSEGAVYVYKKSDYGWLQQQVLQGSDLIAWDKFGWNVAISGDTIISGHGDEGGYVFVRDGDTWSQQAKLPFLTDSVAISGDIALVGDGSAFVNGVNNQGLIHVFVRSNGVWTEQQTFTASDSQPGKYFGADVAISGETIIAGASAENLSDDPGSAYIFKKINGVWTEQQKLTASDGANTDQFGCSVAISGNTFVIGSKEAEIGGVYNQGAAYVFTQPDNAYLLWTK